VGVPAGAVPSPQPWKGSLTHHMLKLGTLLPLSPPYLKLLSPLTYCQRKNQIFNFALGYFVPPAFEHIKWKVYLLFGVFCAAMTIHVFFLFPETAGKSLEQVEEMFIAGGPAWKTHVVKQALRAGAPKPWKKGDVAMLEHGSDDAQRESYDSKV
jgi:hypothetical protein